ncbi:hypothetical protein GGR57DRAFT_265403 [Xylariaceae sp. FL1272]|nr:hypothetical protein GGR57DRAFT_265403 [Xylariaceae sp. FL1272]
MAAKATPSLLARVCLLLGMASLISPSSATDVTITATDGLPQNSSDVNLNVVINTLPQPFPVLNLTSTLGTMGIKIVGELMFVDQSNYTSVVNVSDPIIYLSCDTTETLLSPSDTLNAIINNGAKVPKAIVLFSEVKQGCDLDTTGNLTYANLWTVTSVEEATTVKMQALEKSNVNIYRNGTLPDDGSEPGQTGAGSTSPVAMSILYSITGLITLLFLVIIATGAIRAHRHPERYGPRAGTNGRPRQSRAKGIARAMLETLPIVKFGESDNKKPDEEHGDDASSEEHEMRENPHVLVTDASGNVALPRSSTDAATQSSPPADNSDSTTGTTTQAPKNEPETGDGHLGCSICTEDFTKGEDVRVLPCNHKYHPACVDPWLVNVSGTCPLCRLDLRPPEVIAAEAEREAEREERRRARLAGATGDAPSADDDAAATTDDHLAPPVEAEPAAEGSEATHRRRRSRLLDWNRLRHAPVDERISALREYRQSQQESSAGDNERRRHSRLTDRIRGRFHRRGESSSGAQSSETPEAPSPPAASS